jgi:K+-transporting ATPase KdpF subunit
MVSSGEGAGQKLSSAPRQVQRTIYTGLKNPAATWRLGMEAWTIAMIAFALFIYLLYALLWPERF